MFGLEKEPNLTLERLYIKDSSFEIPSAEVFTHKWEPELDIKMNSETNQIGKNLFETELKIVIKATNNNAIAFIVEVTQAGIFLVENVEEDRFAYLFGAYIPNLLFPFLREAVNDLAIKGSFPQLLLAPVDFDEKFRENMKHLLQ